MPRSMLDPMEPGKPFSGLAEGAAGASAMSPVQSPPARRVVEVSALQDADGVAKLSIMREMGKRCCSFAHGEASVHSQRLAL